MFASTRLLILGFVVFGLGVALYYWDVTGTITASSVATEEAGRAWPRTLAVVLSLGGMVIFALGFFQRLRGR